MMDQTMGLQKSSTLCRSLSELRTSPLQSISEKFHTSLIQICLSMGNKFEAELIQIKSDFWRMILT